MSCNGVKKDGNLCGVGAKYMYQGNPRCGTHMRGVDNKDDYLITGAKASSKPASPKAAIPAGMNVNEIWNAMITRIEKDLCAKPITASDRSRVREIGEMNPPEMENFIKGLLKSCPPIKTEDGIELNLDLMIIETRPKMNNYRRALAEKFDMKDRKFYPHNVPDDAYVLEALPCVLDTDSYVDYNENGSSLYFEDVDITVVNCKTAGGPFMKEWLENENNIYIGPAFAFPGLVTKDSSYFIPPNDEYMSRVLQNEKDTERIISAIKAGDEDASKYLSLKGKTLGSVCVPYPCHSTVFIEVIRWLEKQNA